MTYSILSTRITPTTLVSLRDRTRQVAEIFGLGKLESTRFITAVSEIARNAVQFAGGGSVAFFFKVSVDIRYPQAVVAVISDKGEGIKDIEGVLAGKLNSKGQVPVGVVGAKRLADVLTIESPEAGGTVVTIEMHLPKSASRITREDLVQRTEQLARQKPKTPIEELEKQNREMLDTLQELRQKQQELTLADERKNQFLATLAHELRNPLGTLHMNLEILARNPNIAPDELGKRREAMVRQTEQMNKLIEDMMDVSRVSQGKVEMNKAPVELNELLSQALEMTGAALAGKQHQVTVSNPSEDIWINGDATRLRQAIGNLIQNAARYTPPGGDIKITINKDAGNTCIEIADNGIGIAEDMLPHIFEMFVQGALNSSAVSPGGLGIGLTLVRRLIEAHGGKVTATSKGLGQGSEFRINLPITEI